MVKNNILIPCNTAPSGLAAVRSLGSDEYGTTVVGQSSLSPELYSKYTDNKYIVRNRESNLKRYKKLLLDIGRSEDCLTIFPLSETDIYVMCKYREDLSSEFNVYWPDIKKYNKIRDRKKLLIIANEIGIPIPDSNTLAESDLYNNAIIKSRYSILSNESRAFYPGVEYVTDAINDKESIIDKYGHNPLIQEYIQGPEFGYFAVVDKGNIIASFQHQRIRSNSYGGGASVYRKSVKNDRLNELGSRLLEKLEWTGPAMVEFKQDTRDNKFKLMEINPRFWGSLNLAVTSGVNFPVILAEMSQGRTDPTQSDYRTGVHSQRLVYEFNHLGSILAKTHPDFVERPQFIRRVHDVLFSIPDSEFDFWDSADPIPFIINLARVGCQATNKLIQKIY